MDPLEFSPYPNELHKHTGVHRRQEDLRLHNFQRVFNDGIFVSWPGRQGTRVSPTLHPRSRGGYLVEGERAGDRDAGPVGIYARSSGSTP